MNRDAIAKEIVEKIVEDITDRAGIGNEWEQIDEDIQKDIIDEWMVIICNILDGGRHE
jgi:hypothetical protein